MAKAFLHAMHELAVISGVNLLTVSNTVLTKHLTVHPKLARFAAQSKFASGK